MALDVTPLGERVTLAEVAADRRAHGGSVTSDPRVVRVALAMIGVIIILVLSWLIGLEAVQLAGLALSPFLIAAPIAALLFWAGAVGFARYWRSETADHRFIRLDRFAATNGLAVVEGRSEAPATGVIFEQSRDRFLTLRVVSAQHPLFEVANLVSVVRIDAQRSAATNWTYLEVPLDRPLPHVLLDSKRNDSFFGSTLPEAFRRSQVLSLEGDFDQHFTLYCPEGYERDALYLFTPDVMAVMIDHAADFDVEVIGDRAYFFVDRTVDLASPAFWTSVDAILDSIAPKLARVSDRYTDERAAGDRAGLVRRGQPRVRRGVRGNGQG